MQLVLVLRSTIMQYSFRPAHDSDIQDILDIYNAAIIAGGASADTTPRTYDQRRDWVHAHEYPYGVFVVEAHEGNDAPATVGFGAISQFHERDGYDGVTDYAYYVHPDWQRNGVGSLLLRNLIEESCRRGMRKAVLLIFADNEGSTTLAAKHGFTRFGVMERAAYDSTGTLRDMSYWQLDLQDVS